MKAQSSKVLTKLGRYMCILALGGLFGCTCMARGPERYRDDTRAVLEQRSDEIKTCYDAQLDEDGTAGGLVVVSFTVKKETGVFTDISVVESETTAGKTLAACVLEALQGLKLEPVDQRDGLATFTWEFKSYDQAASEGETGEPTAPESSSQM